MKNCTRCKLDKETTEYSKSSHTKDGLYSYCKECRKQYRIDNRDKIKQNDLDYIKNNPDKFKESQRLSKQKNKDKINKYRRKYRAEVLLKNPIFVSKQAVRDTIRGSIKSKGYSKTSKTQDILGCSFEEFNLHIESLWEPWMNWGNYGNWNGIPVDKNISWDIDHIIPSSTAKSEDDVIKLNHYTNLQPLCSYINRYVKKDN